MLLCAATLAQEPAAKPADAAPPSEKAAAAKSEEKPALPFQIQLLETHVRFEANGDSRKEVHTIVKINDLAGARQFSRLGFDYNRAFQQVEIPLVKISHSNGGTSEILPSAITDAPNPAVQEFPAYHDVRVKSVRVLGLQDGDTIEYRVITTTTEHPLAPDFWLEHTFDRSGQVLEEDYRLEIPKEREVRTAVSPELPASTQDQGANPNHTSYHWHITPKSWPSGKGESTNPIPVNDIVLSTFASWGELSGKIKACAQIETPEEVLTDPIRTAVMESWHVSERELYHLVSAQIATVDLPLELRRCPFRDGRDVFSSGYGTPQDKARLLGITLAPQLDDPKNPTRDMLLYTKADSPETEIPRPSLFTGILFSWSDGKDKYFLDPSLEVAPFGMIRADVRGKKALSVWACKGEDTNCWVKIPEELPFASTQKVNVEASIGGDGALKARVKYAVRGDNELVLRVAFHQTAKERWKEVAGLLALSDGFRGTITNVTASDPMATKEPFTVEYEITQLKFVDWSKKPVRIPALLPQIALPDAPRKTAGRIELGTPLDVQTSLKLTLPAGTTVQTPAATSVARDYATFASKYDGHQNTVTVSRHINFVLREIPVERAADYNAFLRAVQNDQAQMLVLLPAAAAITP